MRDAALVTTPAPEHLRYLSIELGADGLAELDGAGRRVVFIPRGEIDEIELCRGLSDEHPALQILSGVLLSLVFLLFLRGATLLFETSAEAGLARAKTIDIRAFVGVGIFGIIGPPWLGLALMPAWFLRVRRKGEARKLVFHGRRIDRAAIEALLRDARRRYGYEIRTTLTGFDLTVPPYR